MSYGTPISSPLPTIGQSAAVEAGDLNTLLTEIITRLQGKVTPSGMSINADIDFFGDYGPHSLRRVSFDNQTDPVTDGRTLWFSGNELYVNTPGGNVQITNAGALNLAATGQITGSGYGSNGKEFNWDNANLRFKAKSGSGSDAYANIVMNDLVLNDGSGNFLTLGVPALAADFTWTLPNAQPAAQSRLMVSAAGVVGYESRERSIVIPATAGGPTSDPGTNMIIGSTGKVEWTAAATWNVPIQLPVGSTIKSIDVIHKRGSGSYTVNFNRVTLSTGASNNLATSTINAGTSVVTTSLDPADETATADRAYYMALTVSSGAGELHGVIVYYTEDIA